MITSLEDLLCTIDSVKSLVQVKQPGSSVVFKFAMDGFGRFLNRLSTELSSSTSTADVFHTIESFHAQVATRLSVLDGVRNKAELSAVMKETHAQINDALPELSRARFNPNEFYGIVDRHVNIIGERFNNYQNPTHKEFMGRVGNVLADDVARQWEAVGRIAAILETIKRK